MRRVLVVDDNSQLRRAVGTALTRDGYEVTEAADGAAALVAMHANPADLVLTDIVMPGREGVETIFALRERWPDVPIVAMSGGGRISGTDYLATARLAGASSTLAKPFRIAELLQLVRQLLVEPPDERDR
jgi:DNA-binding response OmpR family regulator